MVTRAACGGRLAGGSIRATSNWEQTLDDGQRRQLHVTDPNAQGGNIGMLVSILIINFNGAALTRDCLRSLRGLRYPRYEIVLLDNGSTAAERAALDSVLAEFPSVKFIASGQNLGFAGGNNRALQAAEGDLILLLNNDTIANPDFLSVLVDYFQKHPEVGVVQGKMLLPRFNNTLDVCGSFATALGLPYHYGYYKPDGPKYQQAYPVFCGKGACLMFRREVPERAGGFLFDPDFFCYYEETDFCHRAWVAGYETQFVPSPPIQHLMGATSDRMKQGLALQHYLRNMAFSLWGNLSWPWLLRIMPLFVMFQLLGGLAGLLRGRIWQFAAHWQAILSPLVQFRALRARRRLVVRIRQIDDRKLFRRVKWTPRLEYFLKTSLESLDRYVDDPV
jgi:GT2 family glycosyltransferase